MKILAVDTALGACSVAVLDTGAVRAHRSEAMERGHAEALAPMVQAAMREAAISFGELERLAVTTGPGTFTGQRVGVAFMRGLRIALNVPLVGVTTLEAMAEAAMAETGAQFAAALHDARRDEVYVQVQSCRGIVTGPALLSLDEAIDGIRQELGRVADGLAFAGTAGAAACERYRSLGGQGKMTSVLQPDAVWVALLASQAQAPASPPRPFYLRPPDARLPVRDA